MLRKNYIMQLPTNRYEHHGVLSKHTRRSTDAILYTRVGWNIKEHESVSRSDISKDLCCALFLCCLRRISHFPENSTRAINIVCTPKIMVRCEIINNLRNQSRSDQDEKFNLQITKNLSKGMNILREKCGEIYNLIIYIYNYNRSYLNKTFWDERGKIKFRVFLTFNYKI